MERYCGVLSRQITSRRFPYGSLNRYIFESTTMKALVARYDLQGRLPEFARSKGGVLKLEHSGYDGLTVTKGQGQLNLADGSSDKKLRKLITKHLADRFGWDVDNCVKYIPEQAGSWGKVELSDGDFARTQEAESGTQELRDSSYVRYEVLVSHRDTRSRHRVGNADVLVPFTLYGQIQTIIHLQLKPGSPTTERELLLVEIKPCQIQEGRYGFKEYERHRTSLVLDLTVLRAVVGRIWDRGKWVIVERKGGIDHAQYMDPDWANGG